MEAFMDQLNQVVVALQGVLSGKILVVLLVGTGIWFTIKLRGVQFVQFGRSLKAVFGNIKLNGEKAGKDGMSSFQSLTTAIAAQVGTGNLAGAATAMVMGGSWCYLLDVGIRYLRYGYHLRRSVSCTEI